MTPSAILHRRLCLIRWTQAPYLYPSKEKLLDRLKELDISAKAKRSLERDIRELRDEYGITIKYNHQRRGYYLQIPPDEDVEDFNQFVALLERHERLSFLQSAITNVQEVGSYLLLEKNDRFLGSELLPILWEALRSRRIVEFIYTSYNTDNGDPISRIVEPGILFEYRNRWYLDGWDVRKNGIRTFGLDRITNLTLSDRLISVNRTATYKNLRRHVIGVTCPTDALPERIVLRFTSLEAQYVRSLPIHHSQKELGVAPEGYIDFEIQVIPNHELEREILAYGEAVEVILPAFLKEKIERRVRAQVGRKI